MQLYTNKDHIYWWWNSPFVFGVHVGPMLEEIVDYSHSVVACCKVERCGMPAFLVPTVDNVRVPGHQSLRGIDATAIIRIP